MIPDHHSYRIHHADEPVETAGQGETSKCVVLVFYDRSERPIRRSRYGYITPGELYKKIDQKEPIDISGCYVKGFSLEEYKAERNLSEDELVDLPFFKAQNAFFDHDEYSSFAHCRFTEGPVDFSGSCFANGSVHFDGSRFGDHPVEFSKTRFGNGTVDFQFAEFGEGGVRFNQAIFKDGDISFVNTNFGDGAVEFRHVQFGNGKVDFHFARFGEGNVSFDESDFGDGTIDMRRMELGNGRFYIRRARFGEGDLALSETTFGKGRVNFRSTTFGQGNLKMDQVDFGEGEVTFENCAFDQGSLSFRGSTVGTLNFRECRINDHVDLRLKRAQHIDFSQSLLRDILDLIPDAENPVNIRTLKILRMRSLGRILIDWDRNGVEDLIMSQNDTDEQEKADQFRTLKQDFSDIGEYEAEDEAYVRFRRLELKAERKKLIGKHPLNFLWVHLTSGFKKLVFDHMGLYATSPSRVLISMIATYVLFSLIFFFMDTFTNAGIVSSLGDPQNMKRIWVAFYHSAITFLTIGYGDYYPAGHNRWISSIEGFIGVFLMAYFTVAFVRKILR